MATSFPRIWPGFPPLLPKARSKTLPGTRQALLKLSFTKFANLPRDSPKALPRMPPGFGRDPPRILQIFPQTPKGLAKILQSDCTTSRRIPQGDLRKMPPGIGSKSPGNLLDSPTSSSRQSPKNAPKIWIILSQVACVSLNLSVIECC